MIGPEKTGRGAALIATLTAALMVAQHVGGKAARDTLFLSVFPATHLPRVMVAAAVISIIAALAMSRWLARRGPAWAIPLTFTCSAALFIVEWLMAESFRSASIILVYLHTSIFGGLVISGFWGVINERYDPHTAKKVVGRIGAGAAFGGVVGGAAAHQIGTLMNVWSLLPVFAGLNLLCAVGVRRIGQPLEKPRHTEPGQKFTMTGGLSGAAYLRQMASLVFMAATISALVEYALKSEAAAHFQDESSLIAFFSIFYTATAVLAFVVQSALSRRALEGFGLAGTIAVLPAAVVLSGVLAASVGHLWAIVLLCGAEEVIANSLFRSGYEPLYTPLAAEKKRPAKVTIDVAFNRLGSAVGGAAIMALLLVVADPNQILIGIAVALAVGVLWNARQLHGGYVLALAESLRTGAIDLKDSDIVDATTRRTLSETTQALNREQLLAEIQAFRSRQQETSEEAQEYVRNATDSSEASPEPSEQDPFVATSSDLLSGDPVRIRQALTSDSLDARGAPLIIPILGDPRHAKTALRALRKLAQRVTGQLIDALLDPDQPMIIRRRIPRVLETLDDRRTYDGLLAGLAHAPFEARYACGIALAKMKRRDADPAPDIPQTAIYEAVTRELAVEQGKWEGNFPIAENPDETGDTFDDEKPIRPNQRLEHVFTLLGLALDGETIHLCLRSLNSGDERLRGTSLEYLENVLPDNVRRALWPRLGLKPPTSVRPRRSRQQVHDELLQTASAMIPIKRKE